MLSRPGNYSVSIPQTFNSSLTEVSARLFSTASVSTRIVWSVSSGITWVLMTVFIALFTCFTNDSEISLIWGDDCGLKHNMISWLDSFLVILSDFLQCRQSWTIFPVGSKVQSVFLSNMKVLLVKVFNKEFWKCDCCQKSYLVLCFKWYWSLF